MVINPTIAAIVACFSVGAALSIAGDTVVLRKAEEVEESNQLEQLHLAEQRAFEVVEFNTTTEEIEEVGCMGPGKLLFLHIMKNGGTAIDVFLSCKAELLGGSMSMRLGPYKDVHGRKWCGEPAAVCSTHGRYIDRKEQCGSHFDAPDKVFTALRDPVDRVFSLYNYLKEGGAKLPPLVDIFRACRHMEQDPAAERRFKWHCSQFQNHMVLQTFARTNMTHSANFSWWHVHHARDELSKLDAVFFLDNFDTFEPTFARSQLLPATRDESCKLERRNPTRCPTCTKVMTQAERHVIEANNQMDIILYSMAKELPNRVRDIEDAEAQLETDVTPPALATVAPIRPPIGVAKGAGKGKT